MSYQDSNANKTRTTGFGAGWFIAGGLVVALIAGGFLYSQGYFNQEDEISIELKLPNLDSKKITTPIPGTEG